jgi:hypothetical protein
MEVLNLFTKTVWLLFTTWNIVHTASVAEPGKFRPSRRLAWGLFVFTAAFFAGKWLSLVPMATAKCLGLAMEQIGMANALPLAAIYGWLLWRYNRHRQRGAMKASV